MSLRVLIVSEQPDERARAASALHLQDDVEVVEADSAGTASTSYAQGGFDVLVVDADLYPKGGTSWLYEVHGQAELHGTTTPPSVLLTAREQDRFLADWAGATRIVRKPVDGFELARVVRELTEG